MFYEFGHGYHLNNALLFKSIQTWSSSVTHQSRMPSVTVILVTGGQVTEIFARFGKKFGQYGEIFARFCEKNGQYGSTFTHFGEKLGDMVLFHFGHEAQMTRAVTVDDRGALCD
jgi:hypothetical protein